MAGLAGDLDVALLPIWGWGPTIDPGHMDPAGAARAARLLAPRIAVPIHWGTLFPAGLRRWRGAALRHPPRRFAADGTNRPRGDRARPGARRGDGPVRRKLTNRYGAVLLITLAVAVLSLLLSDSQWARAAALVFGATALPAVATIVILAIGLARLIRDRGVVVPVVFGALAVSCSSGWPSRSGSGRWPPAGTAPTSPAGRTAPRPIACTSASRP